MSKEFAIAEVKTGRLNALVKNLMRQINISDPDEAVRLVNSGEWVVSQPTCKWHEHGGIVYFSVTSDGTTGPDWIGRLEKKDSQIGEYAKQVLRSPNFKPTNGEIIQVAVLKGMLLEDNERTTKKFCAIASVIKLGKPNVEVACLIREKFTDEEIETMGLRGIVTMHEPIKDYEGDLSFLIAGLSSGHRRCLGASASIPDGKWGRHDGFAFCLA